MSVNDQGEDQPWPVLIGAMVLLKQQLAELDPRLPFTHPRLAATEQEITAVEARWGPLEEGYRDFLAHVNGWENFLWFAPLLDTAALCEPANAAALAAYHQQCEIEPEDLALEHLMPLGAADNLDTLVMMGRAGTPIAGQVISWDPSSGGERFATFREYFLDCVDTYERVIQNEGARPVTFGPAQPGELVGRAKRASEAQALVRLLLADPSRPWPWSTLVRALDGLKGVLAARGHGALWGSAPGPRASEEQLYAVRQRWTVPLDVQHADLLRAVDGWANLLLGVDLLSADQLRHRERMVPAVTHLNAVMAALGRDANEFLVIASSAPEEDSRDTVVVSRATGAVVWLREGEVVRDYADVRAWIVNVIGHHVTEIRTTSPL